jgi:excisionase family DNA binding protein
MSESTPGRAEFRPLSPNQVRQMEARPVEDRIVTAGEVAQMFGVSTKTVDRWEETGKLRPAFRTPGGHRRYRLTEVQALIERGREQR